MYLYSMYVRKKHNRSGTTSVVVVSKTSGKYKEIKSFGASSSEEDIESRCNKAAAWIRSFGGQQDTRIKNEVTKQQVNRRGYNKFLEISKDIDVSISEEKIAGDCKWDGLKGYITNTDLDAVRVTDQYHGLWVVERVFRISKGTLEMRPMFHFTERRIEAHICICFIVYKVYKELERLVAINKIGMSVDHVLYVAKTITTIKIRMPENGAIFTKTLFRTDKHRTIMSLFDRSKDLF